MRRRREEWEEIFVRRCPISKQEIGDESTTVVSIHSIRSYNSREIALLCGLLSFLSAIEGLAGAVLTNGTPAIGRHVIGGGGGHAEVGDYVLDGTIGQAVVGAASNAPYDLCSGFWCGTEGYRIYLPLVVRDFS